jgi:methionyl-tRNA synthetase
VPADIYVRYLRIKNKDVIFFGGSDETWRADYN